MPGPESRPFVTRRFHDDTRYVRAPGAEGDASILMGTPPNLGPAMGDQDLAIEPSPYKRYPGLDPIPLPTDLPPGSIPALDVLVRPADRLSGPAIPTLAQLAQVALRSNGLLKRWSSPWGREIAFRAASCTGARYHLELYFVTGDLPGLPAGVYHYGPEDHALRLLRSGDFRQVLADAGGAEPNLAAAPVIAVTTSVFWRNAWRYQERAWRHAWWDAGTMLANLVAVAGSGDLPTGIVTGFVDRAVNDLLGLDGEREAALAMVAIGRGGEPASQPPSVPPLRLEVEPPSPREIDFPMIRQAHAASNLARPEQVAAWRANPLRRERAATPPGAIPLRPLPDEALPADSIETVIGKRRSNRHYAGDQPLPFELQERQRGKRLPGRSSFEERPLQDGRPGLPVRQSEFAMPEQTVPIGDRDGDAGRSLHDALALNPAPDLCERRVSVESHDRPSPADSSSER